MLIGGGLVLTKSVEGIDGVEGLALLVRVLSLAFVAAIVHVSASRNRSSGKLLRAQAVRMESALERAGDRLAGREALLDTLGIGIARIGRDGVIEVANSSFKRFYLYDEGPAFGHSLATEYDSYGGKAVPWYMTSVNRASRGEIFSGLVVWMYGLDGEWRALETSTRNLEQGVEGNDDATALLVRDITGEAGSRESRTLRSVVHELRNPLTAVLGHLDLVLDRDDLDADIRSQLEIVERASERLHVLVDDILSNGEAHRNGGDLSYSLADVVRASTEAFTPVAQNLGVTLTLELDDPLQLCGDAFGMRQVVDNVLSNAIKYSPRGSLVTIRGRRLSEDPAVVLEITDTGLGIAEDELPRIFEMEYRTMSARESDVPGTGLGLGISRNIVEQNGGRMRLDSRLGQGTAVTIVLPTTPEGEASS